MGLGGSYFGNVYMEPGHRDYPRELAGRLTGFHGFLLLAWAGFLYYWYEIPFKEHVAFYLFRDGLLLLAGAHIMAMIGLNAGKRWVAWSLLGVLVLEMFLLGLAMWMAEKAGRLIGVFVGLGVLGFVWLIFQVIVVVIAGKTMRPGDRINQ